MSILPRVCPLVLLLTILLFNGRPVPGATNSPFAIRGYYTTFMRMPTFGMPEWKSMVDGLRDDGGNTLLLWTAGAFKSRKFPITWEYNRDHQNIRRDFVRELIDHAHQRGIRVLLGFTPFAYDGVNQYPLQHPELKATQKNGEPARFWGMHSWGYNLCPAREPSRAFLLEYIREMFFEFYPTADGLLIESSDYAICHCTACREKFFDHEFRFVRQISDEVWKRKPDATIVVYPHYFSGRPVPGFEIQGARQPFDPRWTLFFTPHSAHIDTNFAARARSTIWWTDGLTLGTPAKIREGALTARRYGLTGFVPSFEPFSCIDGPPGSGKSRMKPFHFEWLRDGQAPHRELPMRVNRIAYREFIRDPNLPEAEFRARLEREIFGDSSRPELIEDLFYLQESFFLEADWFRPPPLLLDPKALRERAKREKWPDERMKSYGGRIERLRQMADRHRDSEVAAGREMARLARWITSKWE